MAFRQRLRSFLIRQAQKLNVRKDPQATIGELRAQLQIAEALLPPPERDNLQDFMSMASEMVEARLMSGPGPWGKIAPQEANRVLSSIHQRALGLKETVGPLAAQGAFGDIELALQNVEWRREVNLSWLEFSRWGIQQIILIARLYYIKNPIMRRLIDISAFYVFGRGVEVSSPDKTANAVLKDFFERNSKTLGQIALTNNERKKYYDGNLFFALFPDTQDTGQVNCRLIDATEINNIVTNPDDSDEPWYYERCWTQREFDPASGNTVTKTKRCWYPALGYDPPAYEKQIQSAPVEESCKIHHRKCGTVGQWLFGCPIAYPALDWAKASREFLESVKTVKKAQAQFAYLLTTKGGQQAIEGFKQQLSTTVSAQGGQAWDTNPTANNASIFAAGPGTKLELLKTAGTGGDPEEVRRYLHMCCMVFGVPETFLADVKSGNLATAKSLDRPTELCFLEKQEAWREDLLIIAKYVLSVSGKAPSGKLKESRSLPIREAKRTRKRGKWVYEAAEPSKDAIEIMVTFPAIVEGDIPETVAAIVEAMTLQNKGGQVVGIDEKAGVLLLSEAVGLPDPEELVETMYPSTYDPDRTKEELPDPIGKLQDAPAGTIPGKQGIVQPKKPMSEAARMLLAAAELVEAND